MINFYLKTLGCAKNSVDSEAIEKMLTKSGFGEVFSPLEADVIIVNTCGFIESAKEENIEAILDLIKYDAKIVVTGCLVERYYNELKEAIPEVDLWVRFKDEYALLARYIEKLFDDSIKVHDFDIFDREANVSDGVLYLKISEGCDNFCAFCAIPYIRGRFVSYDSDKLVEYVKNTAKVQHFNEICIIGQDPTSYGKDLKNGDNLLVLLKKLVKLEEAKHIRLLYLYPRGISDELIEFIKNEEKIIKYFDIPIQHISQNILKGMNRRDDSTTTKRVLYKIKKEIPEAIFRTTFIVGFPGETNRDFLKLLNFVKTFEFNHLGAFTYSREEGTRAFNLPHQVREYTKVKRKDILLNAQKTISYKKNKELIGKTFDAYVISESNGKYEVRFAWNSPDGIDGNAYLKCDKKLNPGDEIKIKVTHAFVYDLYVELA